MNARLLSLSLALCCWTVANMPSKGLASDNTRFVNPLIGTAEAGHTYPGATTPFGLVQASPDTGNMGWKYCSGYHYEDQTIMGFSQTHLSGTGCPDLGDVLLLPFTGEPRSASLQSRFSHQQESVSPGYYAVELEDYHVKTEVTATPRGAFYRFAFENSKTGHLLIDLRHGIVRNAKALESHVVRSELNLENPNTVSGYSITKGWGGERHVCFSIQFKEPIADATWLSDPKVKRNQRVVLTFTNSANLLLHAKLAISTVDIGGAKKNLAQEIPGWDFEGVKKAAQAQWNQALSSIEVEASAKEKEIFYTALYHAEIVPNNIADVDGRYRGADNKVYTSPTRSYYSTLSLWDTYRASNPLYTLLRPDLANDLVASMLAHFEVAGYLPMWALWAHENHCMIGNHAIPVIVDAYLKGIRNYDVEKAYEAIKTSSTVNHPKAQWDLYTRYGYLPYDQVKQESVSRTLECAYDDWCVAQMAKALGKQDDYKTFSQRSLCYRNLFDAASNLMRGKASDGRWRTPFDSMGFSHAGDVGGDYTEANAWQYSFHVQQNPEDLIALMGGNEKFVAQLDKLFSLESTVKGGVTVDITGLIGQYVHGNEPCHHVAYLYNYAGAPYRTQERIHSIVTALYDNTPQGLCGNDDCGQMSAWYMFSVLGFYPVNPANGVYVLGSPSLKKASLKLQNGKSFTVETVNSAPENFYIQRVELNNKPCECSYITHRDIVQGGLLKVFMGPKPNREFGKAPAHCPKSAVD